VAKSGCRGLVETLVAHPCKERKDGATSVLAVRRISGLAPFVRLVVENDIQK
jgi:hypothetical protein